VDETPVETMHRLIAGAQVSQAIHVAASLGICDLLADGPRDSDALAAETDTHAPSLYRLLRALAALGVLHEDDERRFSLTPQGELLRSDVPGSVRGWAAFVGRPHVRESWTALEHSIRTGENAFKHVHGTDVWSYRAERPEESAAFDRAMQSLTGGANRALIDAYDFGRFGTIVDVGGGNGALLAALLAEHPALHGVVFDQAHVVGNARTVLAEAGVADRCKLVAGSFFERVPSGGDAYVLKSIIHDWDDGKSVAILRVVRQAMTEDGTLLLIERIVDPPNAGWRTKFSDLNMLVMPDGRERTIDEWETLLEEAGYKLVDVTPASGFAVIAGAPV
jgi:O-methyltransferase/methyltransferase family protein